MISSPSGRWRRFSLRTLFVLISICCVLLGLWSIYVNPFRRQAQSRAAAVRLQGDVVVLPAPGPPWFRWIVAAMLGPDEFVQVVKLDLSHRPVDDTALHFPRWTCLPAEARPRPHANHRRGHPGARLDARPHVPFAALRQSLRPHRRESQPACQPARLVLNRNTIVGRFHRRPRQAHHTERAVHSLDADIEPRRRSAHQVAPPLRRNPQRAVRTRAARAPRSSVTPNAAIDEPRSTD